MLPCDLQIHEAARVLAPVHVYIRALYTDWQIRHEVKHKREKGRGLSNEDKEVGGTT